jgi:hypothetical protein
MQLSGGDGGDGPKMYSVPALVPQLPAGILVTTAMQEVIDSVLDVASSSTPQIGFCGMGGIGKTVVSTWVVREPKVRKQFGKLVPCSWGFSIILCARTLPIGSHTCFDF